MCSIVAGFERATATSSVEDAEGPFQKLCSQVAGWHSGATAPRPDSLLQVFKGLLEYVFEVRRSAHCCAVDAAHPAVICPCETFLLHLMYGLEDAATALNDSCRLVQLESRLPCLHGALQLVHKLPARHAPAAAAHLQECRTRLSQDSGSSDDILTTVEQALQVGLLVEHHRCMRACMA